MRVLRPWIWLVFSTACSDRSVPSPFLLDAGDAASDAAPSGRGDAESDAPSDPTLGGPCNDDGQCDDAIPCTIDSCDPSLSRCRHLADDSVCADDIYCNGVERCDARLGCRAGEPVLCSELNLCTISACVESTQSCVHMARDADGDGDPIWNCPGGGDCDDTDPLISSLAAEVCGNGKDDDCDGQIDETDDCTAPAHDTCGDALLIDQAGNQALSLVATRLDYPTKCAPDGMGLRDAVVALSVPEGPPTDVDVVATVERGSIALGTAMTCGDPATASCAESVDRPMQGAVSRMLFRGLDPGLYPLYVAGSAEGDVLLSVAFSPAAGVPQNETCATAMTLVPGMHQTASLPGSTGDLATACAATSGDLVYAFELAAASDVRLHAAPLDAYGVPTLSLRAANCRNLADELSCRHAAPAELFARALPPGSYFMSVSASGPSSVDVWLETAAPSAALPDEGCAASPPLLSGHSVDLTLSDHVDAVNPGCLAGAPDSTHALELDVKSDVLLVERISPDDSGAVSLLAPACGAEDTLSCDTSTQSPVRTRDYGLLPGSYRAVAESALGTPVSLTAFTRAAVPPVLVAFADDCASPFEIPETGGRFLGSTVNATADFDAGCDVGGQAPGGAPDQILHLKLNDRRQVVFDMSGSDYWTMLSVRAGASCPGTELPLACAAGYDPGRSFLNLALDPGDYYVQIDGYYGAKGAWRLDVFTSVL